MSPALARVCEFYSDFNRAGLWQLPELYVEDCFFQDPVQIVKGLDSLKQYFDKMAKSLVFCQFEFHTQFEQDETAFLVWTMRFSHPRLARGETLELDGVTELHFTGQKVSYHRDYYDLGAMLYEQLPVLGGLVKSVKSRIA